MRPIVVKNQTNFTNNNQQCTESCCSISYVLWAFIHKTQGVRNSYWRYLVSSNSLCEIFLYDDDSKAKNMHQSVTYICIQMLKAIQNENKPILF